MHHTMNFQAGAVLMPLGMFCFTQECYGSGNFAFLVSMNNKKGVDLQKRSEFTMAAGVVLL